MFSDIPNQTKPMFSVFEQNRLPVLTGLSVVLGTVYLLGKVLFDPQVLDVTGIAVRNVGWHILIFASWSFTGTLIGVSFRDGLLSTAPLSLGFYGLRFAPREMNDLLTSLSELGFWIGGSCIIALLSASLGYGLGTVVVRYR